MYNRDKEHPMKQFVENALDRYLCDTYDCGAGYDILRYARRGLILVDASVSPQVFLDWYPMNQGYVLLRLAKAGKLKYNYSCEKE
jgi:hypothetical protein